MSTNSNFIENVAEMMIDEIAIIPNYQSITMLGLRMEVDKMLKGLGEWDDQFEIHQRKQLTITLYNIIQNE